jgi:hypothetical protein
MRGLRGFLRVHVKIELLSNINRFRTTAASVRFFNCMYENESVGLCIGVCVCVSGCLFVVVCFYAFVLSACLCV